MTPTLPTDAYPGSAPYLTLRHIDQFFGQFQALKDISLSISEGEFICFLGPSGCGKTTLLRIIAGLDCQSSGELHQAGRDISLLPVSERDFGIVFQSYALFPNLSVADNIAYGLHNRGATAQQRQQRVAELLATIGLSGSEHKYPAQLSGGQQQRIALARALATSPGLLLLDEPLSALDARVRAHLRNEIKSLQAKLGVTTIMVTHDQEEALTMADRIVVMNAGVIEQVGTPQEIYSQPASAFVADFVGQMNFVSGEVLDQHTLQIGGRTLHCHKCRDFSPHAQVRFGIRPEDVRLRGHQDEANRVRGTVTQMEFLGSFMRSRLQVDGLDAPLLADISMNELRDLNIRPGQQLDVTLPAERLHLFSH